MDPAAVLKVAVAAATDAAAVHRANLGRLDPHEWDEKGARDFVTRVDHEAEARSIERILSAFPDHRILAEEAASLATPSASAEAGPGWLWLIDPLDGTTNYLHGYPMYSASVAALHNGEIIAGAVVHGVTGQTWTAVRGGGAFLDGQRIVVSATDALGRALIGTGFPFKTLDLLPDYLGQFDRVMRRTAGIRRAGSAALDLCHVATGYFDGFWELWLAPWDMAAGTLIVREAGGRVTRMDGSEDVLFAGSVLAGNPRIHGELSRLFGRETG